MSTFQVRQVGQFSKFFKKVIKLYVRGRVIIRVILTDMEFEKVSSMLVKLEVNIAAAQDHRGAV